MSNEYIHMIANLIAVFAVMLILIYLIKKFKLTKMANNKHIKIINAVSLGAKEKLVLLEVNNVVLLVGATTNHIETLHVFPGSPKQEVDFAGRMAELAQTTK